MSIEARIFYAFKKDIIKKQQLCLNCTCLNRLALTQTILYKTLLINKYFISNLQIF